MTVVAILLLLRRPLLGLIPLLRKLKWKELELEFEQKLIELKAGAVQALPAAGEAAPQPVVPPPAASRLIQMAELSPRAAIMEAWIAVERAAANAISRRLPEGNVAWSDSQMGQMLATHNILNDQQLRIYNELRQLRNKAAHHDDFPIEAERAADYVRLAEELSSYLDRKA